MSAERNTKLLREIFDQLAVGKARALTDAMADDFRWIFPGHWSWSGTWEPKSEVVHGLLRPLMAQFAGDYRCAAESIVAQGDRVVVQARGHGTTLRGERYDQTYCFVYRVTDGRLREVVEHCDTALVDRVLDRIPRSGPGAAA
ncbi:nuclear transport factor 2 family protein [Amycolatopsis sp. NBC_00438]|uniref:nuclear transport factor 2 family protein n=1 Tax=Amycolatopsis sp. NBC_00438 TaxID=2903558 RepID=UPI002E230591